MYLRGSPRNYRAEFPLIFGFPPNLITYFRSYSKLPEVPAPRLPPIQALPGIDVLTSYLQYKFYYQINSGFSSNSITHLEFFTY